jgi:predicted phosphodiesterase
VTKLLILSDSHNSRLAIENILAAEADSIDALIFLGDGLRDLEQALTFYPSLRAYAVAGNCDFGALEPLDGLAALYLMTSLLHVALGQFALKSSF